MGIGTWVSFFRIRSLGLEGLNSIRVNLMKDNFHKVTLMGLESTITSVELFTKGNGSMEKKRGKECFQPMERCTRANGQTI